MKRSASFLLALLFAFPAWAEETLVLVVVDGKPVSDEPRMLDPAELAFTPTEWQAWGVVVPRALRSRDQVSAKDLGVAVDYDALAAEVRIVIPASLRPGKKLGYAPQLPEAVSPAPKGVMVDYDVAAVVHGDTRRLSLGHVALPFPAEDPVYGFVRGSGRDGIPSIGSWLLRGENGAITIALGSLTRLRSNPFWPLIDADVAGLVALDAAAKKH